MSNELGLKPIEPQIFDELGLKRYLAQFREDPEMLRVLINEASRGLLRALHPDRAGDRGTELTYALNEVRAHIDELSLGELGKLVDQYIEGPEGAFGVRLQLRNSRDEIDDLQLQIEQLKATIVNQRKQIKLHIQQSADAIAMILSRANPSAHILGRPTELAHLNGYFFYDAPQYDHKVSRGRKTEFITSMRIALHSVTASGAVMSRDVYRPFSREKVTFDEARRIIFEKANRFLAALYEGNTNEWKNQGILVGLSRYRDLTGLNSHGDRLHRILTPGEYLKFIRDRTVETVHRLSIEHDALITTQPIMGGLPPKKLRAEGFLVGTLKFLNWGHSFFDLEAPFMTTKPASEAEAAGVIETETETE